MARRRFDLPDALDPRIRARGRTSSGWPPSRHGIVRATPGSVTRVARRDSEKGSRKERMFDAVKLSSMLGSARRDESLIIATNLPDSHRNRADMTNSTTL